MSSKKDAELLKFLESISLEDYYENFQTEKISFTDLEFLENDDIEGVIKRKFHRKKFFKGLEALKSPKKKEKVNVETKVSELEGAAENPEKPVQLLVKWNKEIQNVFDVPLNLSNEMLLWKVLQTFIKCELKLQDEKRPLAKELKSFTLRHWVEKHGMPEEETIRAALTVKGPNVGGGGASVEELEKLRSELGEVEKERENLKKLLERSAEEVQSEKEKRSFLDRDLRGLKVKLETTLEELETEREKVKQVQAELRAKLRREEPGSIPGFKAIRGIYVPQNVQFVENDLYRSDLVRVFSKGNKVASASERKSVSFKTSTVWKAGKKYYFQATATVKEGGMGFGLLKGVVEKGDVGDHQTGWGYHFGGTVNCRRVYHKGVATEEYGPKRKKGKHVFGVFCDFTNGKREVSFVIDGKNWGVAYSNVETPVSPAFYFSWKGDSFKIEDVMELPDCL